MSQAPTHMAGFKPVWALSSLSRNSTESTLNKDQTKQTVPFCSDVAESSTKTGVIGLGSGGSGLDK